MQAAHRGSGSVQDPPRHGPAIQTKLKGDIACLTADRIAVGPAGSTRATKAIIIVAFPQDAPPLQELSLQATIAGMRLDLGEVGQRLPANCRAPSCVTTNGTSATIEDAVDAAAQLRGPFAFNDSFTPEADSRSMALLTQSGCDADMQQCVPPLPPLP